MIYKQLYPEVLTKYSSIKPILSSEGKRITWKWWDFFMFPQKNIIKDQMLYNFILMFDFCYMIFKDPQFNNQCYRIVFLKRGLKTE